MSVYTQSHRLFCEQVNVAEKDIPCFGEAADEAVLNSWSVSRLALEAELDTSRTAARFVASVVVSLKMPWSPLGIPCKAEITTEVRSTFQRF